MNYGALCLLPPAVIIVIAVLSRNTVLSLLVGILTTLVIQYGGGFVTAFIDLVYKVGCAEDTVWYEFFVVLFACMLGMWSLVGATKALAVRLQRYATNKKRTLVLTWLVGVIVFIDDFTSIAVNSSMTHLYDKNRIPRAMLTYIADSTASPICILVPFGTWAVYYQSVFGGYSEVAALGSPMSVYCRMIPSLFYGWAALIIPLLVAVGVIKPLGAMRRAWERAETTGELYGPATALLNKEDDAGGGETAAMKQIFAFLLPLAAFIVSVIVTGDVIIATLTGIAVMVPYYLITRLAGMTAMMRACVDGVKDMAEMILIVVLAYMLRDALIELGLPDYVVSVAEPFVKPALLPFITFFISSLLTFSSGSNWGATLTVAAVIIPLCTAVGGNLILVLSAIVSGSAFGAHACFYCDVTVFTSAMTKIDNMEHAITQLPYSLIGLGISCAAYLAAGFLA